MSGDPKIIRFDPTEDGVTRAETEMNNKHARGLVFQKITANKGKVWIFMYDPNGIDPPEPPPT